MIIPDRIVTRAELRRNNGDLGAPRFIACKGIVYDVTGCPRWRKDLHEGQHFAGLDLTDYLSQAPHTESVFLRPYVKVVGRLEE